MSKLDQIAGVRAGSSPFFFNPRRANAQAIALSVVVAIAGLGTGACLTGCKKEPAAQTESSTGYALSDGTKGVLGKLASPVEIRFYELLDAAYAPESLKTLAGRADEMLTAFEQSSGGKLSVKRFAILSKEATTAAAKEGLKVLDLEKGDPSFLGLVVAGRDKKETLPLLPEWEPAMESDLARAIARVAAVQIMAKPVIEDPKAVEKITTEINRVVPDIKNTSVEDGTRLLREAALNDFRTATAEMKQQLDAAEQSLSNAPIGQSDAEKQAALQQVQRIRLEQGAKLKGIAARLQNEIEKFQELKATAGN